MKVAVSAAGDSLDAQVDPRFGRCAYFLIIDTDTMSYEVMPNSSAGAMSGAGIQAAEMVANTGVKAVLTGSVGPNAYQVLSSSGVQIVSGVFGTVREAVERFKRGELRASTAPMGFGMGMGRGMMMPPVSPPQPPSPEEELATLKTQAQMLGQQLDDILRRIEELEKKGR